MYIGIRYQVTYLFYLVVCLISFYFDFGYFQFQQLAHQSLIRLLKESPCPCSDYQLKLSPA
jgi:hypothetical protein